MATRRLTVGVAVAGFYSYASDGGWWRWWRWWRRWAAALYSLPLANCNSQSTDGILSMVYKQITMRRYINILYTVFTRAGAGHRGHVRLVRRLLRGHLHLRPRLFRGQLHFGLQLVSF